MARHRGRAFWAKLVREVEGGASQAAVAEHHGVSRAWLGKWCRRLREEGPAAALLLPVRVSVSEPSPPRRIEARVGDVVVAFDEGTDVAYVGALLRSVGS
jgi:transposase-like protein